jgi:hypothetical protein
MMSSSRRSFFVGACPQILQPRTIAIAPFLRYTISYNHSSGGVSMQRIVKNLWIIWAPLMTSRQYLLALGGTLVGTSLLLVSPMQGTLFYGFLAVILWAGYWVVSLHSTYASVFPLLKRTDQTDVPVLLHQVWGEQLHLDQHKISRARQVGMHFQMKFW